MARQTRTPTCIAKLLEVDLQASNEGRKMTSHSWTSSTLDSRLNLGYTVSNLMQEMTLSAALFEGDSRTSPHQLQ